MKRALMVWPSQRLDEATRYIVAVRHLRNHHRELVPPSDTFKSLRLVSLLRIMDFKILVNFHIINFEIKKKI